MATTALAQSAVPSTYGRSWCWGRSSSGIRCRAISSASAAANVATMKPGQR